MIYISNHYNIIKFLCIMITALFSVAATAQENRDVQIAEESVGRIEIYGYYKHSGKEVILGHGSGFLIDENIVISNEHVVEDYLENIDRFNLRFIPSNGQNSISANVIAVDKYNDLAIIRIKSSIGASGLTIFANSVNKGEKVYQLGYPSLVDSARKEFDGNNKNRVTQTSGEITNFIGSSENPTVYLHNADTARGTSGGPLLNRCGEVLAVNANAISGKIGEAAYRGGATSLVLIKFLQKNNIDYTINNQKCVDKAEKIKLAKEEEWRLEKLSDEKAAQEEREQRERAVIVRQENLEKANMAYNAAWNNAALMLLILILLLIGLTIMVILLRNKVGKAYIICTYVVIFSLITIIIWRASTMPNVADYIDIKSSDESLEKNEPLLSDRELSCVPDLQRSIYGSQSPEELPFIWRNNGCIGRGSQYVTNGKKIELLLMPKSVNTATHYIFSPSKKELVSERYFLSNNEADILRTAAPSDRKCTSKDERLAILRQKHDEMKKLLPSAPNERIVYICS